jgi:predicted RNase H-like HicB family nuclease
MKRRYLAVFFKGPGNYSGYLPDVPGCVSVGDTLPEMRTMMLEALEFHIEGIVEDGDPIPESVTTAVDFAQDDPEHDVDHCVVEWIEVEIPKPAAQDAESEHSQAHQAA